MAQSFYITDGTITINFISGTLKLEEGGWETRGGSGGTIWETITLVAAGATQANIRTAVNAVNRMLDEARKYHERSGQATPVTMVFASEGETTKQAVILDGELEAPHSGGHLNPLLHLGNQRFRLALKRFDYWEALTETAYVAGSAISKMGGYVAPANAAGDVDQRIERFLAQYDSGAGSISKLWAGIRPLNMGLTNFVPSYEAEDGTNLVADTTDVVDAAASGSDAVAIAFTTAATMTNRFTLVVGNDEDYAGEYLLLMRAKVDASGTEVRVKVGVGGKTASASQSFIGDIYISGGTAYDIYELGRLKIPLYGKSGVSGYAVTLNIWAERLSVAGSLTVDAFVLMPATHMIYAEDITIASGTDSLKVWTEADGRVWAENMNVADKECVFQALNWAYPPDGGRLVVVGDGVLPTDLDIELDLFPRYKVYR